MYETSESTLFKKNTRVKNSITNKAQALVLGYTPLIHVGVGSGSDVEVDQTGSAENLRGGGGKENL